MEKTVNLSEEVLVAHTASTSGRQIRRRPSEHGKGSPPASLFSVHHFNKSPLSKKRVPEESSRPTRSVDGDLWGRYNSPGEQRQEIGDIDIVELIDAADVVPNVVTVANKINRSLHILTRETTTQTTMLKMYLEDRTIQDREDRARERAESERFHNRLLEFMQTSRTIAGQADETLQATKVEAQVETEFQGGPSNPAGPPPGLQGSADQPLDPAGPDPVARVKRPSEIESQSELADSGGNVSLQEVERLANVPTIRQSEDHTVVTRVNDSRIQGSISYTHNLLVRTHDRHMFSLGAEVRATFDEAGFKKPGLFLVFDTRGAVQTYSPLMGDGKGSSQKIEFRCCDYGLQIERGKIFPIEGEGYQYHRGALLLPEFLGSDGNTELSLSQFLPSRIKNIPGFDPRIKLQGPSIQPYLLHIEGQGLTGGVGLEALQGSFQLCDTWYIPDVQLLVNLITGLKADDRKVTPVLNAYSPTNQDQALNAELSNQKIETPLYQGIQSINSSPQLVHNMFVASILGIALASVVVFLPRFRVLRSRIIKTVFGRRSGSTMKNEE